MSCAITGRRYSLRCLIQTPCKKADEPGLSVAIVDHRLHAQTTADICAKLTEHGVPLMVYTGYGNLDEEFKQGVVVRKPASAQTILSKLAELLKLQLP